MTTVNPAVLEDFVCEVFVGAGASQPNAAAVAKHLVDSNCAGHHSHGVLRVPEYLRDIAQGALDPAATPELTGTSSVAALVDGRWGFGQVAGLTATAKAIEVAAQQGLSIVGVRRCHHLGRMGDYVERAADANCVMLATAGGHPPIAVAPNGKEKVIGANPIAGAFPTAKESVVLDMATTAVAVGKVLIAAARDEVLAPGLVVDADGNPTTDPLALEAGGALLPFGGHKGYGLALISELLTTALVGSPPPEPGRGGAFARQAGIFIAIRLDLWCPSEEVLGTAAAFVEMVRASSSRAVTGVQVPGDPERAEREKHSAFGVGLEPTTVLALVDAATRMGVTVPAELQGG